MRRRSQVFAFLSAPIDTCLISLPACSLGGNNLTNWCGQDMSGLLKLVEILPLTKIESLGCAASSKYSLLCQRPLTPLSSRARSLHGNLLGSEGAAALAEGLKGNTTLRSLK